MAFLGLISSILLVVGGLNWGLIAVLDMDLVQVLFGSFGDMVTDLVYGLVGLSAVYHVIQGKAFPIED